MLYGAEAIERIMLAYKDISHLAGYTTRVSGLEIYFFFLTVCLEMLNVFKDVQNEKYVKQKDEYASKKGVVQFDDFIKFENVPIVTPNGDLLAKSVSFEVKQGQHCLISGPSKQKKKNRFDFNF